MSDTDRSDSDIEFREVIEFGVTQVENELDGIEDEVPEHAARLLVDRANDILQSTTNFDMKREREGIDDPSEDMVKDTMEEGVIDLLLAVAALDYEYDLRIADAFERRMEFIEDFNEYEKVMQDIDTQQEAIEAFDEHMSEHAQENPHMQHDGVSDVEVGENVDADDYDHDGEDRSYA